MELALLAACLLAWKPSIEACSGVALCLRMDRNVQKFYSGLSNKRDAKFINSMKNSNLHGLIPSCTLINFRYFTNLDFYSNLHYYSED